jgi:glycosyltransferase involved in cell wall biosynthesis
LEKQKTDMTLAIVQHSPTQFDEPFYRYLSEKTDIQFAVYYYGAGGTTAKQDPEIGREVGWITSDRRGYPAAFLAGTGPLQFARQVVNAKHGLIIISGYNHKHAFSTALMAKLKGIPAGLRSDNVLPKAGGRRRFSFIKRLTYPIVFKLYTTGHPVGRQAGEYLTAFGFKSRSLFLFPYAVDHQWFARESSRLRQDLPQLRASWGLPPNGQVVCGVIKFSEREDPLTLVRAFLLAQDQLPEISLLLIGDGPLRADIEVLAEARMGKSIVLPGYQQYAALPGVYAASDLFVHPARGAWEVSVNESLACGVPAITSDAVGSAVELIVENQLGCTFKHGDAAELAMRIVSVLRDKQLLQRARDFGAQVLAEWDYPATAERLRRALEFAARS